MMIIVIYKNLFHFFKLRNIFH